MKKKKRKYEQNNKKPTIILHWQTYWKLDLINAMESILNRVDILVFTKLWTFFINLGLAIFFNFLLRDLVLSS